MSPILSHPLTGLRGAWAALQSSGALQAVQAVESDPNPSALDFDLAEAELWSMLARYDLAFLRHWGRHRLSWFILEGEDPAVPQFPIATQEDLQTYMDGSF